METLTVFLGPFFIVITSPYLNIFVEQLLQFNL